MSMKSSLSDWKERADAVITVYTSATLQVESGPCLLLSLSVSRSSATAGDWLTVIDGLGTLGTTKFVVYSRQGSHFEEFHPPVKFTKGLYLNLANGAFVVTVRYVPIKD